MRELSKPASEGLAGLTVMVLASCWGGSGSYSWAGPLVSTVFEPGVDTRG